MGKDDERSVVLVKKKSAAKVEMLEGVVTPTLLYSFVTWVLYTRERKVWKCLI